jgi:hypothetical protein
MKIKTWHPDMTDKETANLAYWERNVLALLYADGWYNDDQLFTPVPGDGEPAMVPRYQGWRRVLTLQGGRVTFHVPDDFDVGTLQEVAPNWDGHTTEEKWRRILEFRGVEVEP